MHLVAVNVAKMIDPGSVVASDCFYYECVPFPPANRVSVPCRIRILGQGASVGPYRAPHVSPLPELNHSIRKLNDFDWPSKEKQARPTERIAVANRIIAQCRGNASAAADVFFGVRRSIGASQFASVGRFVGIELFLSVRCQRGRRPT